MKSLQGWVLAGLALILLSYRLLPHPANLAKTPHGRITAKSPSFTLDAITVALKAGSARQLSVYLDEQVSVELPETSDTYSKSQAEMVIRDFFTDIVVRNFRVVQKGQSSGFFYCTGILSSKSGNFVTTIFMKGKGGKQFVQAIRFQETEDATASQ